MERIIRQVLRFTRNAFGGPNRDIEEALQRTGGAIYLKKVNGNQPYNPKEEGERLSKVLSVLFPKPTLDVLTRKLAKRS